MVGPLQRLFARGSAEQWSYLTLADQSAAMLAAVHGRWYEETKTDAYRLSQMTTVQQNAYNGAGQTVNVTDLIENAKKILEGA